MKIQSEINIPHNVIRHIHVQAIIKPQTFPLALILLFRVMSVQNIAYAISVPARTWVN